MNSDTDHSECWPNSLGPCAGSPAIRSPPATEDRVNFGRPKALCTDKILWKAKLTSSPLPSTYSFLRSGMFWKAPALMPTNGLAFSSSVTMLRGKSSLAIHLILLPDRYLQCSFSYYNFLFYVHLTHSSCRLLNLSKPTGITVSRLSSKSLPKILSY